MPTPRRCLHIARHPHNPANSLTVHGGGGGAAVPRSCAQLRPMHAEQSRVGRTEFGDLPRVFLACWLLGLASSRPIRLRSLLALLRDCSMCCCLVARPGRGLVTSEHASVTAPRPRISARSAAACACWLGPDSGIGHVPACCILPRCLRCFPSADRTSRAARFARLAPESRRHELRAGDSSASPAHTAVLKERRLGLRIAPHAHAPGTRGYVGSARAQIRRPSPRRNVAAGLALSAFPEPRDARSYQLP